MDTQDTLIIRLCLWCLVHINSSALVISGFLTTTPLTS